MAAIPKQEPAYMKKFNALVAAGLHARRPYEKDWWLNLAFHMGEQYTAWDPITNNIKGIDRPKDQPNLPRPVVNKIKHFVQQQHSFAQEQLPYPDVVPANDDIVGQSDALVALAYAQWAASPGVTDFSRTLSRAHLWALICGPAFLKWTWDTVRQQPAISAHGPFDLVLDPYAEEWSDVRYVVHQRFMDPEQVYDQFDVELTDQPSKQNDKRSQLLRSFGYAPVVSGHVVNELWMKPNRRHAGGLFAVWSGKQEIVAPQKLPYAEMREAKQLPYTMLGVNPRPGSPYYDSHVKDMRSPQMELNKYHAQKIMTRENFANLKWWEPVELDLEKPIDNSAAQVLRGHGEVGIEPKILQPPTLPDNGDGDWIRSEMRDAVGIHETSSGGVEGRLESAKAIELIREPDAKRLSELMASTGQSISHGYWLIVTYAKQFESAEKLITVYSEDGIAEVKAFKAREVNPGIRFRVTMGSGLGFSKAGRMEALNGLWDRGILQDDPQRFLALMDIGGSLPLSPQAYDIRLARNENLEMAKGKAVKPNSWDNHEIHLREVNNFRKTNEYLMLPVTTKSKFEFHAQTHELLFDQELAKLARRQMIAQGGAETAPGPASGGTGPQAPPGGAEATPDQAPPGA